MSADNGIYIAKFSNGFRVVHAQAIDNLQYYPEGSSAEKREWKRHFNEAKLFDTIEEAQWYAFKLLDDYTQYVPVEYGVQYLGEGIDFSDI